MSGESDDADMAADRLEEALERIAHLSTRPVQGSNDAPQAVEVAARLDALIERLREALQGRGG